LGFPLNFKKVELQGNWGIKPTVALVLLYFLVLYPSLQIFFRGRPSMPEYGSMIFFAVVFLYMRGVKKYSLEQLGFSKQHIGQHITIGLITGGLIIAALPLLDGLISVSGLDGHELFSGGVSRRGAERGEIFHPWSVLGQVALFPILKQFFFNGLVLQCLSRKYNAILAVYGAAILFTLADFQLNLGVFILGLITAFLYQLTGTLYASILFHASCSLTGLLLLHVYPRLTTLLVFLF
jgi:membrane protease YdiL (CAAX protease family)